MKRLLFLTLTIATVALLGGCADISDYTPNDQNHYDSGQNETQAPRPPSSGY
jgi:hypothetical protein